MAAVQCARLARLRDFPAPDGVATQASTPATLINVNGDVRNDELSAGQSGVKTMVEYGLIAALMLCLSCCAYAMGRTDVRVQKSAPAEEAITTMSLLIVRGEKMRLSAGRSGVKMVEYGLIERDCDCCLCAYRSGTTFNLVFTRIKDCLASALPRWGSRPIVRGSEADARRPFFEGKKKIPYYRGIMSMRQGCLRPWFSQ